MHLYLDLYSMYTHLQCDINNVEKVNYVHKDSFILLIVAANDILILKCQINRMISISWEVNCRVYTKHFAHFSNDPEAIKKNYNWQMFLLSWHVHGWIDYGWTTEWSMSKAVFIFCKSHFRKIQIDFLFRNIIAGKCFLQNVLNTLSLNDVCIF